MGYCLSALQSLLIIQYILLKAIRPFHFRTQQQALVVQQFWFLYLILGSYLVVNVQQLPLIVASLTFSLSLSLIEKKTLVPINPVVITNCACDMSTSENFICIHDHLLKLLMERPLLAATEVHKRLFMICSVDPRSVRFNCINSV